ncbi:MAG: hypothetical protein R2940_01015 [Syntrophotaleaceae bacterium]
MILPEAPVERCPLGLFGFAEAFGEGHDVNGKRGPASFKSEADDLCHAFSREIKLPTEHPDIVEILHPAVQLAQFHHRLELFYNGALSAVTQQASTGHHADGKYPLGIYSIWNQTKRPHLLKDEDILSAVALECKGK